MKTVAFASAAHEFRNPLNAIVISLEMLAPMIQDERAKKYC
jgi:signal transduction histidine kinase